MNHATMKTTKNKNTNNNHNKNEHVIEYIKDCNEIVAREWEREREKRKTKFTERACAQHDMRLERASLTLTRLEFVKSKHNQQVPSDMNTLIKTLINISRFIAFKLHFVLFERRSWRFLRFFLCFLFLWHFPLRVFFIFNFFFSIRLIK